MTNSSSGSALSKSSGGNKSFLESVNERKVLPGIPEVDTTQRQFPIPVKKRSRESVYSDSRSKVTSRIEPKTNLYGTCRCCLLDRYSLEARLINIQRVDGIKDCPCYIYDEIKKYSRNTFYRNLMVGGILSSLVYFMTLILVILPETNNRFDAFRDTDESINLIMIVLASTLVVMIFRSLAILYLSPYIILVLQLGILGFTFVGNLENDCQKNQTKLPVTAAGQLSTFFMAAIEESFKTPPDRLRVSLSQVRCDQSLKRFCSVNLLSEIVNLIASIRLLLV